MNRPCLEDEKIEKMRRDTARQMRAFGVLSASLAGFRLPDTLKPLVSELARGLCADMAAAGYLFLPLPPE
jgi:hypothetical protein